MYAERKIDRKGLNTNIERAHVQVEATGSILRMGVHESMQTGLKHVDKLVPINCAQCELIIGNRQTGKTAVKLVTIRDQKITFDSRDVEMQLYCVYMAINQKRSTVAQLAKTLKEAGSIKYPIIVAATHQMQRHSDYLYLTRAAQLENTWMTMENMHS